MSTLTIELPDDLANALRRLPDVERNNFAVSALRDRAADLAEAADDFNAP